MRIRDIITEDVNDQLSQKLANLLMALKSEGVEKINTQQLMRTLRQGGYNISLDHLVGILEEMPEVSAASKHSVYIGDLSGSYQDMEVDTNAKADVSKQAQDVATKSVKDK